MFYFARGTTKDCFSGQYFRIFDNNLLCFVLAIFDLVHYLEAIHGLC